MLRLIALLLLTSPALAGQDLQPDRPAKVIDFIEVDDVEGAVSNPAGTLTQSRVKDRQPSLIQVRRDFRTQLLASAEDL